MRSLSIVIPALNEEDAIGFTLDLIPREALRKLGWETEVILADNGSTDRTAAIAVSKGARVAREPVRGYGKVYKSGIREAHGEIFCTGDADGTYPFDDLPRLVALMEGEHLDFLTTDRFKNLDPAAMPRRNRIGNIILSVLIRGLYGIPLSDSQSGMWLCRKELWDRLRVRSDGMAFSQEFKLEAVYFEKVRWREVPITYRARLGEVKLKAWKDGFLNLAALFKKRLWR